MQLYCSGRARLEEVALLRSFGDSSLRLAVWKVVSHVLSYPSPGLMRPEDSIEEIIELHRHPYLPCDDFEDVEEILDVCEGLCSPFFSVFEWAERSKRMGVEICNVGELVDFITERLQGDHARKRSSISKVAGKILWTK